MGCCFSNDDDKDPYRNDDADERTRLLNNPVSNNAVRTRSLLDVLCPCFKTRVITPTRQEIAPAQNVPIPPHRQSEYNTPVPTTSQKENQQSALDRILQKTARKVIDVSAVDTVEQTEYHDRSRQYSNRVNMVLGGSGKIRTYRPSLPNGVNIAPHTVLSAPPVSLSDIKLITSAAERAARAVKDVKVTHKEDLVVPFGVP